MDPSRAYLLPSSVSACKRLSSLPAVRETNLSLPPKTLTRGSGVGLRMQPARTLVCKRPAVQPTRNTLTATAAQQRARKLFYRLYNRGRQSPRWTACIKPRRCASTRAAAQSCCQLADWRCRCCSLSDRPGSTPVALPPATARPTPPPPPPTRWCRRACRHGGWHGIPPTPVYMQKENGWRAGAWSARSRRVMAG